MSDTPSTRGQLINSHFKRSKLMSADRPRAGFTLLTSSVRLGLDPSTIRLMKEAGIQKGAE